MSLESLIIKTILGVIIMVFKERNALTSKSNEMKKMINFSNVDFEHELQQLNSKNNEELKIEIYDLNEIYKNLDFILKVRIDRSVCSVDRDGAEWSSSEIVYLYVHIYAKFLGCYEDKDTINMWEDFQKFRTYSSPKILSASGERYLPKIPVDERLKYSLCDEKDIDNLKVIPLDEYQIITELKKYYNNIISELENGVDELKLLDIDESNYEDEDIYDTDMNMNSDSGIWTDKDFNEYYTGDEDNDDWDFPD